MVAAFDYCLHGRGGAAPSIDTAMHGLVEPAHVDHLHPDAGIALATAADGEALTKECFGDRVAWVPWRRPGLPARPRHRRDPRAPSGGDRRHPRRARHHRVGRRRATSARPTRSRSSARPRRSSPSARPARAVRPGRRGLRAAAADGAARAARRAPCCSSAGSPRPTGRRSGTTPTATSVLDFLAAREAPAAGRARHVVPRPLPAHEGPAAGPRPAADGRRSTTSWPGCASCTRPTATTTAPTTSATPTPDSPPMRGADPAIVLVPGVGMFSFGANKQTARVAGEFYVNAINVMRGAEAVSTYAPIPESEKFRIEYWALEEAKLQRGCPKPEAAGDRVALRDRARLRDRQGDRPPARRRGRVRRRRRHRRRAGASGSPARSAADVAVPVTVDVTDADAGRRARSPSRARLRRRRPRRQQRRAVDLEAAARHDRARLGPAARRHGQGLVPRRREAARIMIDQGMGGDIVYICSKNALFAGPNNVAYGAAKADQAHQVRLLAAELGEHGIRVNGINPDGVVRGSGIFAKGWGAERPRSTASPRRSSASSTPSGRCSSARSSRSTSPRPVFALTGGDLALTTGLHIPVGRRSGRRVPALTRADLRRHRPRATSGRVVNVRVDADTHRARPVHRFPTEADRRPGRRLTGTSIAVATRSGWRRRRRAGGRRVGRRRRVGGRLRAARRSGRRLGPVHAYRSSRTDGVMDEVRRPDRPGADLRITGIQFLPINTLYQLVAAAQDAEYASRRAAADGARPRQPRLCGSTTNDVTNASTTQLLDVSTRSWATSWSSRSSCGGTCSRPARAGHRCSVRRGSTAVGVPVVAAASHDTASAVAGTPLRADRSRRLHLVRTWSLVGCELAAPSRPPRRSPPTSPTSWASTAPSGCSRT